MISGGSWGGTDFGGGPGAPLTFSVVRSLSGSRRRWLKTMVNTACERLLVSFMFVAATVLWGEFGGTLGAWGAFGGSGGAPEPLRVPGGRLGGLGVPGEHLGGPGAPLSPSVCLGGVWGVRGRPIAPRAPPGLVAAVHEVGDVGEGGDGQAGQVLHVGPEQGVLPHPQPPAALGVQQVPHALAVDLQVTHLGGPAGSGGSPKHVEVLGVKP